MDVKNYYKNNRLSPEVYVSGKYEVKGHLMVFDLYGSGYLNLNFTNIDVDAVGSANKVVKNGKNYLDFYKADVKLDIEDGQIHMGDLFSGNPELTERTNAVLNENSKVIVSEFQPTSAEAIRSLVLSLAKNVFDTFSIDELLPK